MLSALTVHNFAIIRDLEVSFSPGLNILSGETGAGKSILVGAVNLILGGRAFQEMIRTGAGEAMVEALFKLSPGHSLKRIFQEWELEYSEEISVRRTINRSGRNRVFVNDQSVSLQQLQHMARGLISISGQHEHQLLLDPTIHAGLLDAFGDLELLVETVRHAHSSWLKIREELNRLRHAKAEQATRMDWLRFQLQELESAKLIRDEDKDLEKERNLLKHAATLSEASRGAHQTLYSGKGAMLEQLSHVERSLQTLTGIDDTLLPLEGHLEQSRIHLEEMAHALQQYSQSIAFDPHRMSEIEERLALLQRLGKKYGGSVDAMLARQEELKGSLALEEESDVREAELEKDLQRAREAYVKEALSLSGRRHATAENLSKAVQSTLARLDMSKARFAVGFEETFKEGDTIGESTFGPAGIDRLQFLLSANPGEDLKPLAKVASGGELSRILLALKSLLGRKGEAETLLFDEVDTGIGGRTAELVGLQLKKLAEKHQVVCITHLPQIASYGSHHYKVAKEVRGDETVTSIRPLPPEDRVEELARMLGGISISEKTRAHALELLERAQKA